MPQLERHMAFGFPAEATVSSPKMSAKFSRICLQMCSSFQSSTSLAAAPTANAMSTGCPVTACMLKK